MAFQSMLQFQQQIEKQFTRDVTDDSVMREGFFERQAAQVKRTKAAATALPSQFIPKVPSHSMKATPAAPTFKDEAPKLPSASLMNPMNQTANVAKTEKDIREAAVYGAGDKPQAQVKKPVIAAIGPGGSSHTKGPNDGMRALLGQAAPTKEELNRIKTGHKELGQFDGNGGYQPIKLPFVKLEASVEQPTEKSTPVETKTVSKDEPLDGASLAKRTNKEDSLQS